MGFPRAALLALLLLLPLAPLPAASALPAGEVRLGLAAGALDEAAALGAPAEHAQLWAGVWAERDAFRDVARRAATAADAGAVPVIEWWYWGDDLTRGCVEHGCFSALHGAWKSQAMWTLDTLLLADALHAALGEREAVLVLETEFNKGGVQRWEDFDGLLAAQAALVRSRAPNLTLALGFGAWGEEHWARFDRTAQAVDLLGLQSMRGSTRDSLGHYRGAVQDMVEQAALLNRTFGKPVVVHDVAWSSWPAATHEAEQAALVRALVQHLPELRAAGVEGVVYRALGDAPRADLANYYGEAERHLGLRRADGSAKPALQAWLDGVAAARAPPPAQSAPTLAAEPASAPVPASVPAAPLVAPWWSWAWW
jgi:hypothetical protein